MSPARIRPLIVLMVILATALSACGGDAGDTAGDADPAAEDMAEGGDEHGEDFAWGTPADAAEATRTIEIEAADDFSFDPSELEVETGETVTFRVTNVGQLEHDFTLGDAEAQEGHAEEMAEMDGMDHGSEEPNALTLPPGETVETTWTFTQPGEILIGCHVAGHYEAGMRGTVTIADGS